MNYYGVRFNFDVLSITEFCDNEKVFLLSLYLHLNLRLIYRLEWTILVIITCYIYVIDTLNNLTILVLTTKNATFSTRRYPDFYDFTNVSSCRRIHR
ncbi:MAG: hypothetical protein HNEKOMLI_00337 [Sodalis sp. Psp]|nr:hypothetical protein [Sodalis sp. Psp]MCR3756831.1 hypothetical protein [Sodalis sp. Ppy]